MRTLIKVAPLAIKVAPLALFATLAFAQTDQKTAHENQVRDRGQTPVQDSSQSREPVSLQGTLVDAGCTDRTATNLYRPAENMAPPAQPKQQGSADRSASGVSVDAKTLQNERSDVMEHQVPDLRSRQLDPTCAITGATRAFALMLNNGRLLNFDEGGNTLAFETVLARKDGRAMLNGAGPGIKPQVTVKGRVLRDRLFVQQLQ